MADTAHLATDKELEKMERHLSAIYARAEKDVAAEFKPVLKAIKKKADELYKAIQEAEGEKAEKAAKSAYKAFYVSEVLRRRSDFAKASQNAQKRLYNANQEAARYINSKTAHIYAINYNQIGRGLQRDLDGYSFKPVSEDDAEEYGQISQQTVDEKKDMEWNGKNIRNAVIAGALLYYAADKIFGDVARSTTRKNRESSNRQANDMLTDAESKGRLDSMYRAYDEGFEVKKFWIATLDNRTRDTHIEYDSMDPVELDYEYAPGLKKPKDPNCSIMAEVCNCFIGETKIATDSEVIRSYKHEYYGKLVTVKTAGGVNFTCTPNHPILTADGWVKAETLKDGDNLVVACWQKDFPLRINPYVNHAFPRIDAIHEFLDKTGGERTCSLRVDFHGDIPTSDVEIITKKRLLRSGRNPGFFNGLNKFLLKHTDKSFLCKSAFAEHFRRVCKSALCFVGGFCKAFPLVWRSLRHPEIHRLRPIALLYSGRVKPLDNDSTRNAELICECLDGFSGVVFADNIVSVDFSSGRSHVYNLQTENGYYFVNSSIAQIKGKSSGIFAIAHNCRCKLLYDTGHRRSATRAAREGDVHGSYKKPSSFTGTKTVSVPNMTYKEWMQWRSR